MRSVLYFMLRVFSITWGDPPETLCHSDHTCIFVEFNCITYVNLVDAVGSSWILKAKQKLGVTFNFAEQDVIDLTKITKMTMCRASEANSEK